MQPLNLPEYEPVVNDGRILCLIRKKYLVLTPEEWVRQHFLNLLINQLDYPRGMIRLEQPLTYFKNAKRPDIVVMDRAGDVHLIVECKSFKEKLGQKVTNQIAAYNKVLDARNLAITNGLNHFVWQKVEGGNYVQIQSFPAYNQ